MTEDPDLPWDKRPLTARDFALTVLGGAALLAVTVGLVLAAVRPAAAPEPAAPAAAPTSRVLPGGAALAEQGGATFQTLCKACHTVGGGPLVGPDLEGVTERRDLAWLQRWIREPDVVLAEADPIATQLLAEANGVPMPNLGVSAAEVDALIAFLAGPGQVAAGPSLPLGDTAAGRLHFLGESRLVNGGPGCIACHTVTGIGALGGGALGPDLTQAISKYGGPQGLDAFLAGAPTATMNAVWANRPLSPQERADLIAFMQAAAVDARAPEVVLRILGLAAFGAALMIGLAGLIWRRRLRQVRRPMLRRRPA